MGFLASELTTILRERNLLLDDVLLHMGVDPAQVERLRIAAADFAQVATLPSATLQQLRQNLALTPMEYARLQAAVEADAFFRLMVYHNYPLEEAANKANAVFANSLKDKLATGGKSESVYPSLVGMAATCGIVVPVKRRGRAKKNSTVTEVA